MEIKKTPKNMLSMITNKSLRQLLNVYNDKGLNDPDMLNAVKDELIRRGMETE